MKIPEPDFVLERGHLSKLPRTAYYTHDQLIQALKDCIEECAKVCDEFAKPTTYPPISQIVNALQVGVRMATYNYAYAIREKAKELK